MTALALFDADGNCLGIDTGDPPYGDEVVSYLEVPEGTNPNRIWLSGGVVLPREVFDLGLPDSVLVGAPLTFTIPPESRLYANGVEVTSFDTNSTGVVKFILRGRYWYSKSVEIIDADEQEKRVSRLALRAHQLMTATPRQIDNYVDANVTDLASAREFLKLIAKVLILGLRG